MTKKSLYLEYKEAAAKEKATAAEEKVAADEERLKVSYYYLLLVIN